MYRPIPAISEAAEDLKQRMKDEPHPLKRQRLHALYLLASGQAKTRTMVGQLLGVNRETVGDWLAIYAQGGLSPLLTIKLAPGKQPALAASVIRDLEQALQRPEGFASYAEIQVWLEKEHGIGLKYKTLYTIVHSQLKARPKVARPSHIKKP